jgi:ubiquinone/menaquinone biosynthesis C-methylase UbiE
MSDKKILDACCGSRMFWFDKTNPDVLFTDIRELEDDLCDGRKLIVKPDIQADFRCLPFMSNTFQMVVFDPPHMKSLGVNSWMAKKYGKLGENWQQDIAAGFVECFRVLLPNGVLIFKWNDKEVKLNEVLKLAPQQPLFGHVTGKHGRTIWLCFMKSQTT